MKVLLASWSWHPIGGDWTYVSNLKKMYEENGYEVVPFSTKHEKNIPSPVGSEFFVKAFDYNALNRDRGVLNAFRALKNSIVSFEALANLEALLSKNDIDIAHLNIIHHWLTPAIIWKLKKHNIPIIWSLHDYKIICPEGSLLSKGALCEKCFTKNFYHCTTNKCKKDSYLASALASIDSYLYHSTRIYKHVDYFLCPSEFLLNKYAKFGIEKCKLMLANLCYDIQWLDDQISVLKDSKSRQPDGAEKYFLYIGRVEKTKGIFTLLAAVRNTDIKLKVAGTGAAMIEAQSYVMEHGMTNVHFLGFIEKDQIFKLTLDAVAIVCPSECNEIYPYSIIESFLLQKAVIGSNIGGIPELISSGVTGLLFEPGNADDLREKILSLSDLGPDLRRLGQNAREFIIEKVSFEKQWTMIDRLLNNLVPTKIMTHEDRNIRDTGNT